MNNQQRIATLAELGETHKRRRFTPTQINKLAVVGQSLDDSRDDLRHLEHTLELQLYELRKVCPHPFRFVSWTERVPAGQVKGYCDLCGEMRWFDKYPKKMRDTVRFE
jgi:hypothetical protein